MATAEHDEQPQPTHGEALPRRGRIKRCWHWLLAHKKIAIPATVAVLVIILAAVPFTRFAIAGTLLKQQFSVRVIDKETNKPVSSAEVTVAGKSVLTDGQGKATIKARVGKTRLAIEKKYYKNASQGVVVPILKQKQVVAVKLEATGRQVPVTVINKITKKAVAGVSIVAGDAKAKTDKEGKATLVVPANKQEIEATFSSDGYNIIKQKLEVKAAAAAVDVAVTPAGKIYFLSNLTGKLDVIKSNLDGTDRQVVLAGTGNEDKTNTVLRASRDWKYLALLSRRDGGEYAKLFLIETATDKVTTMDEGRASFTVHGWSEHRFVYRVARVEVNSWESNRFALKSYDAAARKITTLDQTQAEGGQNGYASQNIGEAYLLGNQVVYSVSWEGWSDLTAGKPSVVRGVQTNGQGKKDYKTFATNRWVEGASHGFNEVFFRTWNNENKYEYYAFKGGKVEQTQSTETAFYEGAFSYFISPSATRVYWLEARDGKSAIFVGDKDAENKKQVALLGGYAGFGWYTDEYLLVSKDESELYIMPTAGLGGGVQPQKVTDYFQGRGYSGGHGGY